MATKAVASDAVWAKAEQDYADPNVKISDIAARVGLASIQLSRRAKELGWPMRTAVEANSGKHKTLAAKSDGGDAISSPVIYTLGDIAPDETSEPHTTRLRKKSSPKKPAAKKVTLKPIELVRRVYNTIDGELTKLEEQAGSTSQDRERASRALSQMVNSLEKAVEMQREITKDTTKGSGKKNKEELAHAEDLRRAIAERIERLQSKRLPDEGPAGSDGQ
jgi:hypothetical protein